MPSEHDELAATILAQCGQGALMTLGAHDFRTVYCGVNFKVVIIPLRKDGSRGTKPRIMAMEITLNWMDYYDIRVTYMKNGQEKLHFSGADYDFTMLPNLCVALDFDGPEILNPRIL